MKKLRVGILFRWAQRRACGDFGLVGISKAHNGELGPAIDESGKFDRKIVIEQGAAVKKQKAREIDYSVRRYAEAREEFEKCSGQEERSADQRCSPIIGLEPYV